MAYTESMRGKQIDKGHYTEDAYLDESRFVSYYHQISEVLDAMPKSVLEVGVGDHVLGNYLKSNTGIQYTSLDIAEDLQPDIVGSITALPFPDRSFDVVCAFEVLEHLPFEESKKALSELARVAKKYVILSLPHFGPMLSFSFKTPFLPNIRFAWKIPFHKIHVFNGQHYWEIGKKGYSPARIRALLRLHGKIVRDYVPFNSSYHHFFVIDCQNAELP